MSTTFTPPDVQTQLATFSPTDAAIAVLAEEYLPLTIAGLDDVVGYAAVHRARMDMRNKRVAVEKVRKKLKSDSLAYGRKVDAEAKRLTALLEPIESHLLREEKAVDDEKERIKNAARLKAESEATARAEAEEAERKAAQEVEEARLRAEQERIDAEKAELEAERARIEAEQKAAQDKIDGDRRAIEAEQKRLADIEAERLRAEEMKKAKAEAAEKARVETKERITREAEEKEAAEKAEAEAKEAARLKAEALRPDCDKLLGVAVALSRINIPQVSAVAESAGDQIQAVLEDAEANVRRIVEEMVAE